MPATTTASTSASGASAGQRRLRRRDRVGARARPRRLAAAAQLRPELGRRSGPVGGVSRERAHNHVLERLRHRRGELAQRPERRAIRRELCERLEPEGRLAREQLVEHGAERVDVGGRADVLTERLLGAR